MRTRARTYEKTHPWIAFTLDLRRMPHSAWMLLGEAHSKVEHIAGVPLRPTIAKELHQIFLAKGAHATTAIEGNTLSEEQVRAAVEGKLELPKSQQYLANEIDNIVKAFNRINDRLMDVGAEPVTPDVLRDFDRMVLNGLDLEDGVVPGEFRQHNVEVHTYRGAPWEDCEYLVDRLCDWVNGDAFKPEDRHMEIPMALLKAIISHVYLAWIHPFGDGNGRTARLLEFQILAGAGVPTPASHLLSSHYNMTRTEYYMQLDRTSKTKGDVIPFICYALEGFVDQLRQQLSLIRTQQLDVTWRSHVHQQFDGSKSPSDVRRRHLVLALSDSNAPTARTELKLLSPEVARDYADKTDKTLSRDLNALTAMGLLVRSTQGYEANRARIHAFLPRKAPPKR